MVDLTDPAYEAFLARLVEARTSAGLTQGSVAKRLGKHQSFVSKCESGERRVDVVELMRFGTIYGRPLAWFVE